MSDLRSAKRPPVDTVLNTIAEYAIDELSISDEVYETAKYCLFDSLGCALLALKYPACNKLLGPIVSGALLTQGARIPGTHYALEPVQAAFNLGIMIRWLDYNDTWLAAEWGHPSDNLGGILTLADYLSRQRKMKNNTSIKLTDVLIAMIKAYEIQGVLALDNSFNRVGLDHVILVRIATTAVATVMLGGNKQQIINALSNAWLDGGSLRTYRHAPNTGSRKSWAAGDATSRGVRLAFMALTDEMGYPSALTAPHWGFDAVLLGANPVTLAQPMASYVMENILFKIAFPAEFHAQTAVEAALVLHAQIKDRLSDIDKVTIDTQQAGRRIIDKTGPLQNPADRDHCLQYMVAVALIFGRLTADDYEEDIARDSRIDQLRHKMQVQEVTQYSRDYLDPKHRAIANAVQVFFSDGSQTARIEVKYPVGHRIRRAEAIPLLLNKFEKNISTALTTQQIDTIMPYAIGDQALEQLDIDDFMDMFWTP